MKRRPKLTPAARRWARQQRASLELQRAVVRWIEGINADTMERLEAIAPDALADAGHSFLNLEVPPAALRDATLLELQLKVEQMGHRLNATLTAAERRQMLREPRKRRKGRPKSRTPPTRHAISRDDDASWADVWSPGNPRKDPP